MMMSTLIKARWDEPHIALIILGLVTILRETLAAFPIQ